MNKLNNNKHTLILNVLFAVTLAWWAILHAYDKPSDFSGYVFNLFYAFIPFVGGILGIRTARKWGLKGMMGRSFLMLSLGLIVWAFGGFMWAYYNFTGTEIPYPSLADIGFGGSTWLFMAGLFYLMRIGWTAFKEDPLAHKVIFMVFPIVALIFNFFFLFVKHICVDEICSATRTTILFLEHVESPLERFLDIVYPLNDLILLSLALLVLGYSYRLIGGKLTGGFVGICFSMGVLYVADILFTTRTANEIYHNGDISDMAYATALYLLGVSIAKFHININTFYQLKESINERNSV